ncbi:MAG: GAF domain-containing protein [Cytophagales bacterium]|nr:GAF domain-containing protein [Bernardetiaceae bacterium]MDW8205206.1 GAF domain-containing protein [Cytophagales bacterium]
MLFLNKLSFAQKVALVVSAVLTVGLLITAVVFYNFQRQIILKGNEERLSSQAEDLHHMFVIHHQEQAKRLARIQEAALNFLKINNKTTEQDTTVSATNVIDNVTTQITFRPYQLRDLYRLVVGQRMRLQAFQKVEGGYINITNEAASLNVDQYIFIPNNQAPFTYEADTQIKENIYFEGRDVVLVRYIPCRLGLIDYGYLKLEVTVDFSGLYQLLASKKYYSTGYAYVLNNEGTIIFHPNEEFLLQNAASDPEYKAFVDVMRASRKGYGEVFSKQQKVMKMHFYHFIEPYQIFLVIVVAKSEMLDQLLSQIIQFVAIVFGLLVVVNVIIAYTFVNNLLSPVKKILQALNQVSRGNFQKLPETNRQDELGELTRALNRAIEGLENATAFATQIGQQQYDTHFEPLSKEDKLGNALLAMRNALKINVQQEAERRMISEALTHFSDLIRQTGADLELLCQKTLSELVRFLNAQQGCLYLAEHDLVTEQVQLSAVATFANGRLKFKKHALAPGENLAAQIFIEKQSLQISDLPPDYFTIASGLGSIPPKYLLLVPVKHSDNAVGVIEIASLHLFTEKQQAFVERIAEMLAVSVVNARNNEKMRRMLEETQILAENLRAQEEEMRQNLEELQATQEEMARREKARMNMI